MSLDSPHISDIETVQEWLEGRTPVWPRVRLSPQLEQKPRNNPLVACYAHDVPFRADSIATTITLAEPLAAQVWLGTSGNSARRMVARMYDPFTLAITTRTDSHAANAEIHGCSNPHRLSIVLLEYIPGIDMRRLMEQDELEGDESCHRHKATIVDAVARLVYDILPLNIFPIDMAPRNVLCAYTTRRPRRTLRPEKLTVA
ncbi:hypothetical protein B0H14DRAFT_3860037 [Mycena olivaceomarginata]|nr:hypothetical protein B0H14DRAFT_3860037 [Mycena olivaceomarginata]